MDSNPQVAVARQQRRAAAAAAAALPAPQDPDLDPESPSAAISPALVAVSVPITLARRHSMSEGDQLTSDAQISTLMEMQAEARFGAAPLGQQQVPETPAGGPRASSSSAAVLTPAQAKAADRQRWAETLQKLAAEPIATVTRLRPDQAARLGSTLQVLSGGGKVLRFSHAGDLAGLSVSGPRSPAPAAAAPWWASELPQARWEGDAPAGGGFGAAGGGFGAPLAAATPAGAVRRLEAGGATPAGVGRTFATMQASMRQQQQQSQQDQATVPLLMLPPARLRAPSPGHLVIPPIMSQVRRCAVCGGLIRITTSINNEVSITCVLPGLSCSCYA